MKKFFAVFLLCIASGLVLNYEVTKNEEKREASVSQPEITTVNARVARIIDGDTIELDGGARVRYIGINTPEMSNSEKSAECFGPEATQRNKELVGGQTVRLEKDISDKDQYGRLLRYVWLGDTLVNEELVKEGYAHSLSYPPNIKFQIRFTEAEQEAQVARRGLWDVCQ